MTALVMSAESAPDSAEPRPRCRAECGDERPCPWVGCKYNLYLDVNPSTGSIKLNFPDLEPDEMGESCALDVADRGADAGTKLDDVGRFMNITHERVRQIEVHAAIRCRAALPTEEFSL